MGISEIWFIVPFNASKKCVLHFRSKIQEDIKVVRERMRLNCALPRRKVVIDLRMNSEPGRFMIEAFKKAVERENIFWPGMDAFIFMSY